MRREFLDILRCPKCKKSFFSVRDVCENALEIDEANVLCNGCSTSYKIEDGIVDFLKDAPKVVIAEKQAMDDEAYIKDEAGNTHRVTDETIEKFKDIFLSLPEGDDSCFFRRGSNFHSIKDGSERFYKTLKDLGLAGREKVLEIGACFSWASYRFAERGCKVVAIDISNYLRAARVYLDKAYFDRAFADMHNLPFTDNTFDVIFGSAVLHHTADLKGVFSEIYRVLKKNGRLVLINESARGIFEEIHPDFKELKKRGFGDTSYSIPQWKKGAQRGGFKKIKIDFLSLADGYIFKHKHDRRSSSLKIKIAYFFKRHRMFECFLSSFFILPRLFLRPKS
ncbi:methyltransferase domain-containing protein, partial [Candidatus Omnitrophota bacterium]